MRSDQKGALLRRHVGIAHPQQRSVGIVPGAREVEASFLHPAGPVLRTDEVRTRQRRVVRLEQLDDRSLVGDPAVRPGDHERTHGVASAGEFVLLVLHQQEPAVLDPVEQSRIELVKSRIGLVGAAADHDRVEGAQAAHSESQEIVRGQHLERQTDLREALGNPIRGAAQVGHPAQIGKPQIDRPHLERRLAR